MHERQLCVHLYTICIYILKTEGGIDRPFQSIIEVGLHDLLHVRIPAHLIHFGWEKALGEVPGILRSSVCCLVLRQPIKERGYHAPSGGTVMPGRHLIVLVCNHVERIQTFEGFVVVRGSMNLCVCVCMCMCARNVYANV